MFVRFRFPGFQSSYSDRCKTETHIVRFFQSLCLFIRFRFTIPTLWDAIGGNAKFTGVNACFEDKHNAAIVVFMQPIVIKVLNCIF